MTKQILIAGFGGQGILFSGKFLAYGGLLDRNRPADYIFRKNLTEKINNQNIILGEKKCSENEHRQKQQNVGQCRRKGLCRSDGI